MSEANRLTQEHYLAIQIKAFDDWQKSLSRLSTLQRRLVKNPKGKLATLLFECVEKWPTCSINEKYDGMRMLVNEICFIYDLPTISLHTPASWNRYNAEHFQNHYEKEFNIITDSRGFYFFHNTENGDYINVVVRNWDTPDCYDFIRTLAHEMAHAIIENQGQKFAKNSKKVKETWFDKNTTHHPLELEPLLTLGYLKHCEEEKLVSGDQKNKIYEALSKTNDWNNYTDYTMLWEERCCDRFALEINIILKAAHLIVQQKKTNEKLIGLARTMLLQTLEKCKKLEHMANTDFDYDVEKITALSDQKFRDIIYDAHLSWSNIQRGNHFRDDTDLNSFLELQSDITEDFYALYKIFDEL